MQIRIKMNTDTKLFRNVNTVPTVVPQEAVERLESKEKIEKKLDRKEADRLALEKLIPIYQYKDIHLREL